MNQLDEQAFRNWRRFFADRFDAIDSLDPPISAHPKGFRCAKCNSDSWAFFRQIKRNGTEVVAIICTESGHAGHSIKKSDLLDFHSLPLLVDKTSGICEHCGTLGTETHHWAPTHLFGYESDNWPTAQLCRPCHHYWHSKVTPDMAKKAPDNEPT